MNPIELTKKNWDLSPLFKGLPPKPKIDIKCPQCNQEEYVYISEYRAFLRHPSEYRVDIKFKCIYCGMVWLHGIHIDKNTYDTIPIKVRDWKSWVNEVGHIKVKNYKQS